MKRSPLRYYRNDAGHRGRLNCDTIRDIIDRESQAAAFSMSIENRFSHHSRRALAHAAQLARRFNHPRQDTAHLLVGVIRAQGSLGAQVLSDLDLPLEVAEVYLKRLIDAESEVPNPVPRDPSFETALMQAADESNWLGHHYVGTEHLLLGITRTNVGNAISLLRLVEISPEQIRRRVRHLLSDGRAEFSLEALRQNARLSELSRRVLNAAEQYAVSFDHPSVGIGHLLLALLRERRGVNADILRQSGLEESVLVEGLMRRDTAPLLSVESVVQEAIEVSQKMGSHYVGADHLLLVLARAHQGAALMRRYNVSTDKVQRLLSKHLR